MHGQAAAHYAFIQSKTPFCKIFQGSIDELARLPPAAQAVADFLARIPKQHLAQAASRCGAHARALQDYESYVRT